MGGRIRLWHASPTPWYARATPEKEVLVGNETPDAPQDHLTEEFETLGNNHLDTEGEHLTDELEPLTDDVVDVEAYAEDGEHLTDDIDGEHLIEDIDIEDITDDIDDELKEPLDDVEGIEHLIEHLIEDIEHFDIDLGLANVEFGALRIEVREINDKVEESIQPFEPNEASKRTH